VNTEESAKKVARSKNRGGESMVASLGFEPDTGGDISTLLAFSE